MKRREFLKGLSVAASIASIPSLADINPSHKKWETVGDASGHLACSADGSIERVIDGYSVYESTDGGLTFTEVKAGGEGGYFVDKETSDKLIKELGG